MVPAMKKVIVIGSGGAGKSTFSRLLGEKTSLPVIHLDKLFWHPNWTRTPEDEWIEIVRREIARDEWIMDGNFGGTREMRLQACDTVIFLDMPRWLCIYRILKRTLFYRKETRPDMAEGCDERFDLEFIMWVWNYTKGGRQRVVEQLKSFSSKRIIMLKSTREADEFLELL
jgi:adenylate kinase family enzyme